MYKRVSLFLLATVMVVSTVFTGCGKDDDGNESPAEKQKEAVIAELAKTDLDGIDADAFTVFALSNRALAEAGTLKASKESTDVDIKRHIVIGIYTGEKLTDGLILTEVSGNKLHITVTGGGVYVNGVLLGDMIEAGNSIAYTVNEPIPATPPSGEYLLPETITKYYDSANNEDHAEFEYNSRRQLIAIRGRGGDENSMQEEEDFSQTCAYDASGERTEEFYCRGK